MQKWSLSLRAHLSLVAALGFAIVASPAGVEAQAAPSCPDGGAFVTANVVALDQVFIYNRRGAFAPGMIYALERDVVAKPGTAGGPGNVMLRPDERPRPLTLRVNAGDCLAITFTNLLANPRPGGSGVTPLDPPWDNQPNERAASVHVIGMQLLGDIGSDGSNVGRNASSLVIPGGTATYYLYAQREGTFMMYSAGAQTGSEADGGTLSFGLFGAINVEPAGSEWYRSQVSREEMDLATVGRTPGGQPILDYDATYPANIVLYPRSGGVAGVPILKMVDAAGQIVHSDLTAIITEPCAEKTYPLNPALPNRCEPFREITVIFHDEIKAVQAFDVYNDPVLSHTLHSVRDGFAINYGTGGIGSEIIANRLGLGPEAECNECKYEEFFLTSWALGDPAMVTDVLANASDPNPVIGDPIVATVALYPDDPSNVYHSYLNDHVKIRNLHVGPKEHHIFHLHAHQWLYTPDSDESSYLDSQAIGPGGSYTYDIAYGGGGNRNKGPGDAIFHCHFYPHFAQGMWALWRNHDVFENGTPLDADGKPSGTLSDWESRALPDAEITAGAPNVGVVPMPGLAMAPMPTALMPGYPFYIPGVAGHRPPKPPLDTEIDGGLSRHVVTAGTAHFPPLNRLDFDKVNETLDVTFLPETGTALEVNAMNFHAAKDPETGASTGIGAFQPTYDTDGNVAKFRVNGLPGIAGAPFADPCALDDGTAFTGQMYEYRAAGFKLNATYNKVGWKNPQHHMEALDQDVGDFMTGAKPPEPFFFRANSNSCIEFYLTNLFPNLYQLDDFQVRTPVDVLGQHIHLVKFDVTSSDGSANGWNYEDGSLSPDEVKERIHAIRAFTNLGGNPCPVDALDNGGRPEECPVAEWHPFFTDVPGVGDLALGAQTTIQRWYADELLNNSGDDRTLRTVYTHDHFAPSTQQQAGYYAGLLIEPEGSQWLIAEGPGAGTPMGGRPDGGPTSWQAIIEPPDGDAYREFMFEIQDFALAYQAGADNALKPITTTAIDGSTVSLMGLHDPANAINPPAKKEIGLPFLLEIAPLCPGGVPRPCPEAISADDPGTYLVNYRNEPIALRIADPSILNIAGGPTQAAGVAGDLSHVFRSDLRDALGNPIPRKIAALNSVTGAAPYAPLTGGLQPGDPFTPLFRVYEGDKVQYRTMVGAHEEGHNITVHGARWLFEPSWKNSGYRASQMYGISEHFEFEMPAMQAVKAPGGFEDHLYVAGAAVDNMWNGMWGIMRAYQGIQPNLATLSSNTDGKSPRNPNPREFNGVCPVFPKVKGVSPFERKFTVWAVLAKDVLPGGALVYNSRAVNGGPLTDPNAILYVLKSDIGTNGKLKAGVPIEPLILRANAGDCIFVTLENKLPATLPDNAGFSTMPMIVNYFNANEVAPSSDVGLHAQLVTYDMFDSDGANVGFNQVQTVAPGGPPVTYKWYAGDVVVCEGGEPATQCAGKADGTRVAVPMEFGATALMSSDRIKHSQKGAIGALIIEPADCVGTLPGMPNVPDCTNGRSTWVEDAGSRASATVTLRDRVTGNPTGAFREFVLLYQDDLNLRCAGCGGDPLDANAVPNLAESEDPEDSGQRAFNYKTEPMWLRLGFDPDRPLTGPTGTGELVFRNALSNAQVGGDPETPVFTAEVGTPVRFRVVQSGGHARNHTFTLHGHGWQEEPWTDNSTKLGDNPISEWKGAQEGIGPGSAFNFLLTNGAGGKAGVTGDYLFRDFPSFQFDAGLWGILRVCEADGTADTTCGKGGGGAPPKPPRK